MVRVTVAQLLRPPSDLLAPLVPLHTHCTGLNRWSLAQNRPSRDVLDAIDTVAQAAPADVLLRYAASPSGLQRLHSLVRRILPPAVLLLLCSAVPCVSPVSPPS